MKIMVNRLASAYPTEIKTADESSVKLENDEIEKQRKDEEELTVISSNKTSQETDRFDMMSAMHSHHTKNIRSSVLSHPISDEFFFDVTNLINASIDNIKHFNNITRTDPYWRVKNQIAMKQLERNDNEEKLKLLTTDEDKYQQIQQEIAKIEDDIEVCRKVLWIAEKSTRIYQINTIGLSISIDGFIQQLKNVIEKSGYYTFSENNRNVFISQLDNIMTLIDKTNKHVSEHYANLAEALYNNKLKSMPTTPIHLKKEDIFQQLIESSKKDWRNKTLAQGLAVYEIIDALVKKASQLENNKSTIDPEVETFNIYVLSLLVSIYETDAHAFGHLSLDDIVSTEYIYTYTDERGNPQIATTTIYAYMLRHIEEIDSPLSRRRHIEIKFPKEFQPALIHYLEEESNNIKEYYYLIEKFKFLEKKVSDINKLIPSVGQYLSDFLSSLGDKYNVNDLHLTDEVVYKTTMPLSTSQNLEIDYRFYTKSKTFTIFDILTGRYRKYFLETSDAISELSKHFPDKYTSEMINLIYSVDIQTDYINKIESLKKNNHIKNDFYHYINQLVTAYSNKNKPYYLIKNSPSLLVYSEPERGERTGNEQINYQDIHPEHTPISVISIITGQRLRFSSFLEMKNQIKNNKEIADWFNYHFPLGYKMTSSELRLIKKGKDYSYLYENILAMYLADMDVLVFPYGEEKAFSILNYAPLLTIPAFFMGPLAAFLYGSLVAVLPSLMRAALADTREERDNYLKEAAFAMALEVVGGLSAAALGRIISKAVELYSKVKSPKKIFSGEGNILDGVADDEVDRHLKAGLAIEMTAEALKPQGIKTINSTKTMSYFGLAPDNRIREAIRSNMLTKTIDQSAGLYVANILKQAGMITELQRYLLLVNLEKTKNYTHFLQYSDLLNEVKRVTTMDDLLRIKPGELVIFTEALPNSYRPVHVMIGIGNGRFAGIKNNLLDANLGNGKTIITAEQLGQFDSGMLKNCGSSQRVALNILAGYPKGARYSYGQSMGVVAKELAAKSIADPAKCVAELLRRSGELSSEQALAFYSVAKALYSSNNHQKVLQQLITNQKQIHHHTELMALPKGTVIAFHDNDYTVKKLMVSLGNEEFAIRHADHLELIFGGNVTQLTNGKWGAYKITAGRVNLSSMRQQSLLGKDAIFALEGNKLVIRVHGAPSVINHMDSMEFAHVVKGLTLRKNDSIDLKSVGAIELQSCFGAFGRYPSGQVLANELGKKVVAYPLAYSERIARNPEWWRPSPKIFMPASDFSFRQLSLVNQQHMRNYNFWNKLLGLYKKVTITNGRVVRQAGDEAASVIELLTYDIAKLISEEIRVTDFLQLHTEYYSDGSTAIPLSEISSALDDLLSANVPTDAQRFAEKIIAILSLNKFSFELFDTYISSEANTALPELL